MAEIEQAMRHLSEALDGALNSGDGSSESARTTRTLLACLDWVRGSGVPGGFGSMLAELDAVDREKATRGLD